MNNSDKPHDKVSIQFKVYLETGRNGHRRLCRGKVPKAQVERGNIPRISRLLALTHHFELLLRNGTVRDYAEIAQLKKVTRARLTQVMNLLLLAPDMQEDILFLSNTVRGHDPICERNIRLLVAQPLWSEQRNMWREFARAVGLNMLLNRAVSGRANVTSHRNFGMEISKYKLLPKITPESK